MPGIFNSFTFQKKVFLILICKLKIKKGTININFALYILQTIFQNIDYSPLKETLLLTLFGEFIDKRIHTLIRMTIDPPLSYSYNWGLKNCWDDVPEFITQKYGEFFSKNDGKDKEEEKKPEIIEEIIIQDEPRKPFSKYEYLMNKMGSFKSKLATTSNQFYNYLYTKKIVNYEKEYKSIYRIIVSSVSLNDHEINIDYSFPALIKDTFQHLNGFNKELDAMKEKIPYITLDELNLSFKKNDFSEILKSFFQVNFFKIINFFFQRF